MKSRRGIRSKKVNSVALKSSFSPCLEAYIVQKEWLCDSTMSIIYIFCENNTLKVWSVVNLQYFKHLKVRESNVT